MFENISVVELNKKTIDSQSFSTSRAIKINKSIDNRITLRNEVCVNFNNNNRFCEVDFCIYKHICIKCQQNDHDQFECKNKIVKWLIDTFSFDFFSFSSFFFFFFYSFKMIMSISIEWLSKNLLYDVVFENAFKFEIKMSLKIEKWRLYLLKHFDQYFVSKLFDIIKRNANVEYIKVKKFHIFEYHRSINEIFDIFIANFNKQFIVRRMNKMFFSLFEHHICSLLNLIFKHDDE